MKFILAFVLAFPLLAEESATEQQQQLAVKDAEIAQLRKWAAECREHVVRDTIFINSFLGKLDEIPQPEALKAPFLPQHPKPEPKK